MDKSKFTPGEVVYVIWLDSCALDGWTEIREHCEVEVTPIHTVGFFLKESKDKFTIALNLDPLNGNASESITIPKFAVTFIKKIKIGRIKGHNFTLRKAG